MQNLNWDFRTSPDLGYINSEGWEYPFYYAIDLVTDLAALLLECSVNGSISLGELRGNGTDKVIRIVCTEEEKQAMNQALAHFAKDPLSYDLHEMVPDEDLQEMAQDCEAVRQELCE